MRPPTTIRKRAVTSPTNVNGIFRLSFNSDPFPFRCRGTRASVRILRFLQGGAGRIVQEKIARRYFVSGMVQGVGYRFFATRLAERLGVAGWVKNLADGRVEVYAIGTREALKGFRSELERAPRGAIVEDVREEDAKVDTEFASRFTIGHDRW